MNVTQSKIQINSVLRGLSIVMWFLIAVAYLTFFVLDLRLDYSQIMIPCSGEECNYIAVSQAEFDAMENLGLSPRFYANTMSAATVAGVAASWLLALLILWRQGSTRIGWVVSIVLAIIPITMIADVDNVATYYPALEPLVSILSSIGTIVLMGFLYLFPSGRFYPRWAFIPFLLSTILFEVFSSFYEHLQEIPDWVMEYGPPILLGVVLFAGILQVYRYQRNSTSTERQQTKWVLLGILLLIAGFPVWFSVFGGIIVIAPGQARLLASLGGWITNMLLTVALPVTMAIAISRYRLWDIDLVIRRALQYTLLTGILALTYVGSMVFLQGILGRLTGSSNSPLVTVITTLGIAAFFNPLRTRVQDFIDHRFYRKKYDAEKALAQFAAAARDEVDMDNLTAAMLSIVEETMQPEKVSLWVRKEVSQ